MFQAVAETPEAVLAPRFDGGAYPEAALVIDLTLGDPGRPTADGQGATAEDDSRVRATLMPGLGHLVAEGVLIQAILETPLDTAAPGRVRAQTTRDVLSFDGTRILIPRGSQVVGEYRSDVGQGQSRALIIWSRLIRPDGVAVRLASPAADARGQSGVPGRAAPSFLARFAASALQTAIGLGSTYAAGRSNGPVVVGLGSAVAPSVSSSPATRSLHVTAGAEVSIFVARDLDFGGAPPWP